jgi:hypothetical protein
MVTHDEELLEAGPVTDRSRLPGSLPDFLPFWQA